MSYFFLFVFPFFFLNSVCLPRKINVLLRFKNRFWRRQTRIGLASGSQTQFTWWRLKPLEILLHSSMHAERFRCISNWNILNLCDSLTLVFTSDASTSASIYDILVKWKQTVDASISRRRREERFTSAMLFSVARPIWWHGVPFLLNYFPSHYQHWLMVILNFLFFNIRHRFSYLSSLDTDWRAKVFICLFEIMIALSNSSSMYPRRHRHPVRPTMLQRSPLGKGKTRHPKQTWTSVRDQKMLMLLRYIC